MTTAGELRPPIALGKLTFLCGPPGHGQHELVRALCDRDPDLGIADFLEPIRMATAMLFFNGNFMSNDLTDLSIYGNQVNERKGRSCTYMEWMKHLTTELEVVLGDGILGRIALKNMTEDGEIDNVFARHLFRDTHNLIDAKVFVDKFGPSNCLLLHVGPLSTAAAQGIRGVKSIWLPEPGLESRLRLLEHELNLLVDETSKRDGDLV